MIIYVYKSFVFLPFSLWSSGAVSRTQIFRIMSAVQREGADRISLPRKDIRSQSFDSGLRESLLNEENFASQAEVSNESNRSWSQRFSYNSKWDSMMTPRIANFTRTHEEFIPTYRAWFWICLSVRATKYRKVATFWPSRIFEISVVLTILSNVGLACWSISANDDDEIDIFNHGVFWAIQILSTAMFGVEYGLRLWACVESSKLRHRPNWIERIKWVFKPLSLLDLLCLLLVLFAYVVCFGVSNDSDHWITMKRLVIELRVLLLMRFERQLKALGRLQMILGAEIGELALAGFFTLCLTVYSGVLFYFVEKSGNDDMSMGTAIWWGVQTITSLGYGSVLPQTVTGKILSGFVALVGLIAFAIPAGIISSRFAIIARNERDGGVDDDDDNDENSSIRRVSSSRRNEEDKEEIKRLRKDLGVLRNRVRVLSKTLTSVTRKLREQKKQGK